MYKVQFVTDTTRYMYNVRAEDFAIIGTTILPIERVMNVEDTQGVLTYQEIRAAALEYTGISEEQAVFVDVMLEQKEGLRRYQVSFFVDRVQHSLILDAETGELLE